MIWAYVLYKYIWEIYDKVLINGRIIPKLCLLHYNPW